jgi:hypothetical protein
MAFEEMHANAGNGMRTRSGYLHMNQDTVPGHVRFIRIYERMHGAEVAKSANLYGTAFPIPIPPKDTDVIDIGTWDVIRDALLSGRYDAAQEIVTGTIGPWRPSTIMIHSFMSVGSQRSYVHGSLARALWNVPLEIPTFANETFQFDVINDGDFNRRLICHLVIEDMTPEQYGALRG